MKKRRSRHKLTALALALTLASSGAQALLINATVTGGTTLLSGTNRSVVDNGGTPDIRTQAATPSISKFDSSNGVLLGATITLTPGAAYLRADGNGSARGTASVSATWNGTGGLNATGQLNTVTKSGGSDGIDNSWNTLSQSVNGANLNNWVGAGNISPTVTTTLTADQTAGTFTARIGSSSAQNTETNTDLTASYSVEYNYLQHAAASFDGSSTLTEFTLDFGTVYIGDAVSSLGFSLYNLAGDRVGLDLDGITGSGDTSLFTTDLALFTGLGAGDGYNHLASFDTSSLGSFSATYVLDLSDADVGAASSRYAFDDYLTLNLRGNVIARPAEINDIPEPGMLALISIGLFGLLGLSRYRRF